MKSDTGRGAWSFFNLPVPQYTSVTETIVSDLAWSITEGKKVPEQVLGRKAKSIIYQRTEAGARVTSADSRSKGEVVQTIPTRGDARWKGLSDSLREFVDVAPESLEETTKIFLENLTAHVPAKARSTAAIPLNAHMALLQDKVGLQGTASPPNFALIARQMYALGGGEDDAAKLLGAAYQHIEENHQEDWIMQAASKLAPDELKPQIASIFESKHSAESLLGQPTWLADQVTPFHWFASAWRNVMSHDLMDRMPRRRWNDWVACVLRTGLGTGYIFELNFYYQLWVIK